MSKNTTEAEEQKYLALRNAIKEGIDSGVAINFDPKQHLEFLKKK
jgi:antitoxin ParD1/3/4